MARNSRASKASPQLSSRMSCREDNPGHHQTTTDKAVQTTTPRPEKSLHWRKSEPICNIIIHRHPRGANTKGRQTRGVANETPKKTQAMKCHSGGDPQRKGTIVAPPTKKLIYVQILPHQLGCGTQFQYGCITKVAPAMHPILMQEKFTRAHKIHQSRLVPSQMVQLWRSIKRQRAFMLMAAVSKLPARGHILICKRKPSAQQCRSAAVRGELKPLEGLNVCRNLCLQWQHGCRKWPLSHSSLHTGRNLGHGQSRSFGCFNQRIARREHLVGGPCRRSDQQGLLFVSNLRDHQPNYFFHNGIRGKCSDAALHRFTSVSGCVAAGKELWHPHQQLFNGAGIYRSVFVCICHRNEPSSAVPQLQVYTAALPICPVGTAVPALNHHFFKGTHRSRECWEPLFADRRCRWKRWQRLSQDPYPLTFIGSARSPIHSQTGMFLCLCPARGWEQCHMLGFRDQRIYRCGYAGVNRYCGQTCTQPCSKLHPAPWNQMWSHLPHRLTIVDGDLPFRFHLQSPSYRRRNRSIFWPRNCGRTDGGLGQRLTYHPSRGIIGKCLRRIPRGQCDQMLRSGAHSHPPEHVILDHSQRGFTSVPGEFALELIYHIGNPPVWRCLDVPCHYRHLFVQIRPDILNDDIEHWIHGVGCTVPKPDNSHCYREPVCSCCQIHSGCPIVGHSRCSRCHRRCCHPVILGKGHCNSSKLHHNRGCSCWYHRARLPSLICTVHGYVLVHHVHDSRVMHDWQVVDRVHASKHQVLASSNGQDLIASAGTCGQGDCIWSCEVVPSSCSKWGQRWPILSVLSHSSRCWNSNACVPCGNKTCQVLAPSPHVGYIRNCQFNCPKMEVIVEARCTSESSCILG